MKSCIDIKVIKSNNIIFFDVADILEEGEEKQSNKDPRFLESEKIDGFETSKGTDIYVNLRRYSKTVYIQNVGDTRLFLQRDIPISIEYNDNVVTAISYDLEEFGFGNDEFEALKDIRESIVSLFYLFKEEEDNLGPLPKRQWNYLKDIIIEK